MDKHKVIPGPFGMTLTQCDVWNNPVWNSSAQTFILLDETLPQIEEVKKDEYLMQISPGTDKTPDELFKTIRDFGSGRS